jgi:hypothetical protein
MGSLARRRRREPAPTASPEQARASEYHHAHPHRHATRGVHDHRHGHRGTRVSRWGEYVPWLHWFAEHAHVHPDLADEGRLETPQAPGQGAAQ